jgi:hypothetical protein
MCLFRGNEARARWPGVDVCGSQELGIRPEDFSSGETNQCSASSVESGPGQCAL